MAISEVTRFSSAAKESLRYRLVIIEALLFALPVLTLCYILYQSNLILETSQLLIFAFIFTLILSGLIILRQIFDRFFAISALMKKAEAGDALSIEIREDVTELRDISVSFNNLMLRLEQITEELNKRVFALTVIKELTEISSKILDIDELLNILLDKAMAVTGARIGSVYMVDSAYRQFRVIGVRGWAEEPKKIPYINIDDSLAKIVVSGKRTLLVQDIENDARTLRPNDIRYGSPSFMSMPIFIGNEVSAVLNLARKGTEQVFDVHDEQVLDIMLGEVGIALENAQFHSRVEEKYRLLVENAMSAIFVLQNGVIKFPNPKTIELLGHSADELLKVPFVNHIHQDDREMIAERQKSKLKEEKSTDACSFRVINKKGRELWVEASSVSLNWEGKLATMCFLRDITKQKRLESQLIQLQKMEAIGRLAGGIAHDFNNILTAIIGYAELAHVKVSKDSSVWHNMEQVLKASYRAKDLVGQILAVSRKTEQENKSVQVAHIVKEALKFLRSSLPSTIEIRQEISLLPEKGIVLADPTQIHQVVMNLCTNAARAMRGRGGILSVKLSEIEVDDSFASRYPDLKHGSYIMLTVSDTGHGMDATVMERIFDPYFTTNIPGEGTGLGLAVVQGIVKSYNGMITVNSESDKGAAFDVYLPAIKAEVLPETDTVKVLPTGDEHILFIDDEKVLTALGKEMLETLGYRVTTRDNGIDALETFRKQPDTFDLVFTDMTMPGMTGMELSKEMMDIRPDIPVVLCTGYSELIDGVRAKENGICEFVMKPFVIKGLAITIREVLDERRKKQIKS